MGQSTDSWSDKNGSDMRAPDNSDYHNAHSDNGSSDNGSSDNGSSDNGHSDNGSSDNAEEAQISQSLLRISELGRISTALKYRLKVNDLIVALDGKLFHGNADDLKEALSVPEGEHVLMTVCRDKIFYDVLIDAPLGGSLEFADAPLARDACQAFEDHTIYAINDYVNYEVLRDIRRNCVIYDTRKSPMAGMFPVLWLLENRMWEPLMAILLAYVLTFNISITLFAITYLLSAVYFTRGQVQFQRSYAMFQEKQMWLVLAARTMREAQDKCREIDPYCMFSFTHLPPPEKFPSEDDDE